MDDRQAYYSVIQFSAQPERFEFVNVGLVFWMPSQSEKRIRFSEGLRRVERLFGREIVKAFYPSFGEMKRSFERRLVLELDRGLPIALLNEFAEKRANKMRMLNFQPIFVDNIEDRFSALFNELVGEDARPRRKQQIRVALRNKMIGAGVVDYLDKPRPIELPQGVSVAAQFGYQNGSYNLIDGVRLDGNPEIALREASKRAIEGHWLADSFRHSGAPKKLVVVADFAKVEDNLKFAIKDLMTQNEVKLYSLDNMDELVDDIRVNGEQYNLLSSARRQSTLVKGS